MVVRKFACKEDTAAIAYPEPGPRTEQVANRARVRRARGLVYPMHGAGPWARLWNEWISSTFLKSYLDHAMPAGFLPAAREELNILLNIYLLEKALYELGYELNNRPDWLRIPLIGILQLLQTREAAA